MEGVVRTEAGLTLPQKTHGLHMCEKLFQAFCLWKQAGQTAVTNQAPGIAWGPEEVGWQKLQGIWVKGSAG